MTATGIYWQRVRGLQDNAKHYMVCTILYAINMGLSALFFNLYLTSLGFDAAFIGLNSTLLSGAALVSALPSGLIADRIGRKRSMLLGLASMALAQFGLAVFTQGWLILAANLVAGTLSTFFLTSIAPFLTENSTLEQRSMIFTLDSGLMNIASFVTSTIGGYLPGLFASLFRVGPESATAYRSVMFVSACAMALTLLPILAVKETKRPATRPRSRALSRMRLRRFFSSPGRLIKLVLPRAVMAFGAGLVFPFLNLFFKQRFEVSDATLGWIFGITNVLAGAVLLWGGAVAERLGKVQAMFFARMLSLPGLLIVGFVPSLPLVVLAHWARSALMRLGNPLYTAFVMEQFDEDERATGSSLLSTAWNAGWAAGPAISGLLQPHTGWGPLFLGTIAFYALNLVLVYLFFMPHRRKKGIPKCE
ncbi:MAG: MFS transporter [Anaerolineae bacterium]|nr:MFS transporter [Anaerolineae bacterium]